MAHSRFRVELRIDIPAADQRQADAVAKALYDAFQRALSTRVGDYLDAAMEGAGIPLGTVVHYEGQGWVHTALPWQPHPPGTLPERLPPDPL